MSGTVFQLKNMSGSRAFSNDMSILTLIKGTETIKFESVFNYLTIAICIQILLFLEKGSNKFRIYGLINDFALMDNPSNKGGKILRDNLNNLSDKYVFKPNKSIHMMVLHQYQH